ncbi:hypothetical protein CTAYLR_004768 [Chrysophaeum taylorii]|uniref:Heme oxygenase n=1 Tax=Chrysophaeum taylorii TaxID=2483200 RepID=A0AAD7XN08_9STRA|nr:hypothetical protein CTAYLR_004768 [Chrysophaeum taylorii]
MWVVVVTSLCHGVFALQPSPAKVGSNPRESGLALALDDGTRKVHSVAENTQFVTGFFKGLAKRSSFARLTANLYFVYEAMERALDQSATPNARALDFEELRRVPSLEADMRFYFGDDWRRRVTPSPAARAYCYRIEEVKDSDLLNLYSRYLGDLFGGQMMSGMASKSLGLADDGLAFYSFADIPDTRAFIDRWYSGLNELGSEMTSAQHQAIVDEANVVFRLNIDVFNELEGNAFRAALDLALKSLLPKQLVGRS